ncbi:MAG: cytochrome c biogenesis factor [Francisella sp.]|jgi:cytochrome c biogenesis factor
MTNKNTNKDTHKIKDFFLKFISFEHFITPNIVTFIFWLITACVVLSGLYTMIAAFNYDGGLMIFIYGLIKTILGVLFTKVSCEMLIVLFKINDSLIQIAKNTKKE